MRMSDAIELGVLSEARVVAGNTGLQRGISWVHIVELPEPGPWISRNQLLLTTGYAWSGDDTAMKNLIRELDSGGIAGVCLAVPSYHAEFPDVAKLEADRVGLPLLEVPWEIPFSSISEGINRALVLEQQRHREQAHTVHRSLTRSSIEANTLDEIIAEFSRLIERSVTLEDIDGRIIASHAPGSIRGQAGPSVECPAADESILNHLVRHGYWANIHSSRSASRIPSPGIGQGEAIVVCPVWLKRELEGILWIPEAGEPLGELEIQASEHAATIIALHIARERAVVNVEQRLRYTLIDSLLEGQFNDDTLGLERAALMGFDPNAEYTVTVFVLDEPIPLSRTGYLHRERFSSRLARRLTDKRLPLLISPSMNEVTMVTPSDVSIEWIWEGLLENDVSVCVGRPHVGAAGVRKSYQEARSILPWSRPNTVTTYEELLMQRLLEGDQEAREHFVESMLLPLRKALHADVYLETLKCFSESGFRQNQAAASLGIHPKTMQYRVGRLEEILEMDLSNTEVRFRIQLLCQLLEIAQRKPKLIESMHT